VVWLIKLCGFHEIGKKNKNIFTNNFYRELCSKCIFLWSSFDQGTMATLSGSMFKFTESISTAYIHSKNQSNHFTLILIKIFRSLFSWLYIYWL